MKRLTLYTIILSLSLLVFGCGGPTIDKDSGEYKYITEIEIDFIPVVNYKGDPFNGIIVSYYKSGQLYSKETYKNGRFDGVSEEYYEHGQLKRRVPHKNGWYNGVLEEYYENGQLKRVATYNSMDLDGVSEEYYESGQLESSSTYKNGLKPRCLGVLL